LKNTEAFQKEYNDLERYNIDQTRKAKAEGGFFVPAEAKLILVVRIRGYHNR
jgi:large subunit ribosomal protein L7e